MNTLKLDATLCNRCCRVRCVCAQIEAVNNIEGMLKEFTEERIKTFDDCIKRGEGS